MLSQLDKPCVPYHLSHVLLARCFACFAHVILTAASGGAAVLSQLDKLVRQLHPSQLSHPVHSCPCACRFVQVAALQVAALHVWPINWLAVLAAVCLCVPFHKGILLLNVSCMLCVPGMRHTLKLRCAAAT
jgi:hypothetical protein